MSEGPTATAVDSIRLERVGKTFAPSRTPVLQEITFSVQPGQLVALVGGSGSGKTTTLKCINRLVEADAGEIHVNGQDVRAQSGHELRRRIGYVFQGVGLFPHLTVGENIGITPQLLGWQAARIAERVEALLDMVELPRAYAQRAPQTLSGGERQRVGVARALAAEPAIVLMDEPFGALDPLTRDLLRVAYRKLHARMQLTTLIVTHDMLEALLMADRILVLRHGCIVADASPEVMLGESTEPSVRELFDAPRRQVAELQALVTARARGDA